jgi:hypothetical protein
MSGVSKENTVKPPALLLFNQEYAIYPQTGEEQEWMSIPSVSFTVYYKPGANLKKIESRLRYRSFPVTSEFARLYTDPTYDINRRIANRLEAILQRVKIILSMNPQMELKVKVFRTRKELNDEYFKLFRASRDYVSFYVYRLNTIYTSEQDILDSIISHEMGHAVIDHYFNVVPPEKVAETLAVFVDSHLDRD